MCAPMFIPAIVFYGLEKMRMVPRNRFLRGALELSCVFGHCYLAVPLSVAMFPKFSKIAAKELEPQFHDIKDKDGERIKEFIYNKGM